MGKHLQFGKGEVFFHVQMDGQDIPWETRLSHTHPVCSFVLQSLFRTAVMFRGAENTRPASKSLAPNTGRNSKLAVYSIKLCPALKLCLQLFFYYQCDYLGCWHQFSTKTHAEVLSPHGWEG